MSKTNGELVPLDLEIEHTLHSLRCLKLTEETKLAEQINGEQCTLRDYWELAVTDNYSRIRRQAINAITFELKASLI